MVSPYRLALFGGTFDPPHLGHVALARAATESGRIDELQILPSAQPPHKSEKPVLPAGYRYAMAQLAFGGIPGVTLSDLELRHTGRSYTVDTLRSLQAEWADRGEPVELLFLVGADSLRDLHLWYKPEEILSLCTLWVAARPGVDRKELEQTAEDWRRRCQARIEFLEAPEIDVSSTALRLELTRILAGDKLRVPPGRLRKADPPGLEALPLAPAVLPFILDMGLYGYLDWGKEWSSASSTRIAALSAKLWQALPRRRFLHVLNVMCLAIGFAPSCGVSTDEAALAALLHDCAKAYEDEDCLKLCPELRGRPSYPPSIWHGPAGAVVAVRDYGVDPVKEAGVLQAIRLHSTLDRDATRLDQLVFVADKIEPGRHYADLIPIREALARSLEEAACLTARAVNRVLLRDGAPVAPESLAFLAQACPEGEN